MAATMNGPVRLTRRGRLVVTLFLLAIALVAFSLGRSTVSASSTRTEHESVVVAPGDTLWSIARRAAPGEDPRNTIEGIRSLNGLGAGPIVPGEQLLLP